MRFSLALPFALLTCSAGSALAAGSVAGAVIDRTTGRPAVGDTVALIGFGQGMQVAGETRTDASGRYTLPVADDGTHLVRVTHQKATYFQPVPPGARTVNVDVYDVAAQVDGVSTEADVLSMQTGPGAGSSPGELRVNEDFFVRNSSNPGRTQLSDHAYEFFLPAGGKLQGSAAMGPGGMPVQSNPAPLPGAGHYAFVFPVRPGETRFQVSYTVPYDGKALPWTQREALATENLVVLLPKSMRFTPGGTEWQPVPANPDALTYVRKGVAAQTPVAFTVSGEGELPREAQAGSGGNTPGDVPGGGGNTPGTGASVATQGSMATDTRPGGGLGPPVDTPDPLHRYKGWLLGGLGLLLLGGAGWLMRAAPGGTADDLREGPETARALRPALERALLALEREHALGIVLEPEYGETRMVLQKALHRALAREAASTHRVDSAKS